MGWIGGTGVLKIVLGLVKYSNSSAAILRDIFLLLFLYYISKYTPPLNIEIYLKSPLFNVMSLLSWKSWFLASHNQQEREREIDEKRRCWEMDTSNINIFVNNK